MKDTRDFIYMVPGKIFFDKTLTAIDLKIYMIVRSFMDTTGEAYPTNKWIADKLGIYPRSVPRSIEKLITKGYLIRAEIDGQRHLMTGMPIPEPVDNLRGGCQPGHGGGVIIDMGGDVISDIQLYQKNISSNIINDHVKNEKSKTAKSKTVNALTLTEIHMLERLINMHMNKPLALKIVLKHTIAAINNVIEIGLANGVKNMGAYINKSLSPKNSEKNNE